MRRREGSALGALRCTFVTGGEGGGGEERESGDECPILRVEGEADAGAKSGTQEEVELWAAAAAGRAADGDAAVGDDDEHRSVVGAVSVVDGVDTKLRDETAGDPAFQTNEPEKNLPTVSPSIWFSSDADRSSAAGKVEADGFGLLPTSQL